MAEPVTQLRYLESMDAAYRTRFDAKILKRGSDYVVLDKTLFYPEGGGQEDDQGVLEFEGGSSRVLGVHKKGIVKHVLDELPPEDVVEVRGVVDWARRHAHMRMHTSQHLISGLAYDLFDGARTVGNQIHADRSRIDFRPAKFTDQEMQRLEAAANGELAKGLSVKVVFEAREALERRVKPERSNLDLVPKTVQELRVIEIGGVDACPCGGTHVRSLSEIGQVRILGRSSKGAETTRIEYELAPVGPTTQPLDA